MQVFISAYILRKRLHNLIPIIKLFLILTTSFQKKNLLLLIFSIKK